ncbi:hypothetical protein ILP92_16000 [Maribius pontilimi]|uniref:Secreted protein n=1 Tax=Palleronia pontilimi TaxID=1964209 RepID=A0A934MB18_9RHOB|nr:hypothetical protein [Palleronia pontilimi]MBJ3764252.1 hypothetical protein [Palleronia pontilimi]
MHRTLLVLFAVLGPVGCNAIGGTGDGIEEINGMTIVNDVDGGRLIIDAQGCQGVAVPGSNVVEPVVDADGQPVCVPLAPNG